MCCRLCVPGIGITRIRFDGYNLSPRYGEHPLKNVGGKGKTNGGKYQYFPPFSVMRPFPEAVRTGCFVVRRRRSDTDRLPLKCTC